MSEQNIIIISESNLENNESKHNLFCIPKSNKVIIEVCSIEKLIDFYLIYYLMFFL